MLQNLRTIRTARGYTQAGLAEAIGTTQVSVSRWEAGLAGPPLSRLLELADFLEASVDELVGEEVKNERLDYAA